MMTSEDIRAFFTRFLEVWAREDLSAIVACYAENARVESPLFHTVRGRADI
jgi:ketosteroid isomerase-like protein